MAKYKKLKLWNDEPPQSEITIKQRELELIATVEHYLGSSFVEAVARAVAEKDKTKDGKPAHMMLHQDAFAEAYTFDEFTLCGMAIKYAGLHDVCIMFIGKNKSSTEAAATPPNHN